MEMTERVRTFIREHLNDDITKLLLSAGKYPEMNIPFVVDQIAARKQIREKLPSWYADDRLVFPSRISAEQCSSEQTAIYKQRFITTTDRLCDLTGGLGIDTYYFSRRAARVTYIDRFPEYCDAARYNFKVLEAGNIDIVSGDSSAFIAGLSADEIDVFYIDPARRGEGNKRVYALSDCEPDLPALLPVLLQKAPRIIAKLSPMADIRQTLSLLPGTIAVHVLAVKNECKELLFDIKRGKPDFNIPIYCWNLRTDGKVESFGFSLEEEESIGTYYSPTVGKYLFEPNASILKAGAFKSIARGEIEKLHPSSHLYTLDWLPDHFPGRIFEVEEVIPYQKKYIKSLATEIPRANITVRNFPLSVDELRKRTGIREGGEVYLFATTLATGEKVLIRTTKYTGV